MGDRTGELSLQHVLEDRPALTRALAVGSEGFDVARLQAELRRLDLPVGAIDGIFGDKTTAAVQALCKRAGVEFTGTVDATIWAALGQAIATSRADALAARAAASEQVADLHHAAAAAHQQIARDKRAQNAAAGDDEERAAEALAQAARAWLAAADAWLAAARGATDGLPAYVRHLRALEQGRSHAARAVNSCALAGKDFTAAGATGHELRLATAVVATRDLVDR
jgi:hypothetical protein